MNEYKIITMQINANYFNTKLYAKYIIYLDKQKLIFLILMSKINKVYYLHMENYWVTSGLFLIKR